MGINEQPFVLVFLSVMSRFGSQLMTIMSARAPRSLNSTHQLPVDLNNDQGHYLGRKSWGAIPFQENSLSQGALEAHYLCRTRQVVQPGKVYERAKGTLGSDLRELC